MSKPITFTENATPALRAIVQGVSSPGAAKNVGLGVRRGIRTWLTDLGHQREPKHETTLPGSAPTGWYAQAAQSVTAPVVEGNKVTVSITQWGFRQRLLGGDIFPRDKKYLTIPGSGISYGTAAPEWSAGTSLMWGKDKDGVVRPVAIVSGEGLVYSGTRAARSRNKQASRLPENQILFGLVTKVHQEGDQGLLPETAYIEAWAADALREYLRTRPQPGEAQ